MRELALKPVKAKDLQSGRSTHKSSGVVILKQLEQSYGHRLWQPSGDPLGELVQTILSQNTSDKNSRPAFQSLLKVFPDWSLIMNASLEEIARPIERGGLAMIKARRIQSSLLEIRRKHGSLDLKFLADMTLESARGWLTDLPGVGLKTASCVLLFALGMPAMPVDTHVFRVSSRIGLIPPGTTVEKAHYLLEKMVPPKEMYNFHVLMIEHGRRTCFARNPDCPACVCRLYCAAYQKNSIAGNI